MPIEIVSYVELQDVFPDQECTIGHLAECLRPLPLDLVLEMSARINHTASGPSRLTLLERQRQLAGGILSPESLARLRAATPTGATDAPKKAVLFFRAQLFELVRWALLLCEGPPLDRSWNQDEKELFTQAALICSSVTEATMRSVLDEAEVEEFVDYALIFFRAAMSASLTGLDANTAIGRGCELFLDYLPKHYPDFDQEFEQATGLSVADYMTTAGTLVALHLQSDNQAILTDAVTLGSETDYESQFAAYQANQITSIDKLRAALWPAKVVPQAFDEVDPLNLRPFRQKPIIALSDGRGAVLDPILLADSVSVGPLFQVLKKRPPNEVFGHFGDAFEEYAGDIFSRSFPSGSRLHQCLLRDVPYTDADGVDTQLDYCLDYVNELVLIEAKGIFLPDRYIMEFDDAGYKEALAERYLHGDRPVGVGQLARAIRALSCGAWRGPSPEAEVSLVYPVLLVHDRLLQDPLSTKLVADLLVSELGASRDEASWQWKYGDLCFAPLTILIIDDLENLENSHGIDVRDLLRAYSESVPERNGSLHDFIATTEMLREELRANHSLGHRATDFLRDCTRRVFGKEPGESGEAVEAKEESG